MVPEFLYEFVLIVLTVGVCAESTVTSAALSPPTNIRLNSYNMNLELSWDPPLGGPHGLHYTAEYKSSVSTYKTGCVNISTLKCDFSSGNISVYGTYTSRVQAKFGMQSSTWGQSNNITLDKHTIIGPPSVSLSTKGTTLEVDIKDPVFLISNLRKVYHLATYNVTYWNEGEDAKAKTIPNLSLNRMFLDDLHPYSQYCLQVQINTDRNLKPSKPSNRTCASTTHANDEARWLVLALVFVAVVGVLLLIVFLVMYWKNISQFFHPRDSLTEALEDSLLALPNSTPYLDMPDWHTFEEIYDPVSITAAKTTADESQSPLGLRTNINSKQ